MPKAVFILTAAIALVGSNGLILSPVLSDIAAQFGISVALVGRAITAFGLGTALSALWLGRSLDGFGTAKALQLALIVGGLAQVLASFSTGWITLSLAEALVGLAAGVALPAIYALTAEVAPKGKEAKTLGAVIFGWSISMIAAVPLGAALAELVGWRVMLAGLGALSLLVLPFTAAVQSRHKAPTDPDQIGRLAPLFLPGGFAAYLICFLFMASFYGIFAYTGAHAVSDFGASTARAGLIALFYGAGFGISSFLSGAIDRIGTAKIRMIGFPMAMFVIAGLATSTTYPLFLVLIAVWGSLNNQLLNTIVTGLTNLAPRSKGAALGLYSSVTYLGAATGTFIMGAAFERAGFIAIGAVAVLLHLGIITLLLTSHRRPRSRGA